LGARDELLIPDLITACLAGLVVLSLVGFGFLAWRDRQAKSAPAAAVAASKADLTSTALRLDSQATSILELVRTYQDAGERYSVTLAQAGKDLPNGSYLFAEVWSAKLDDAKNPIKGADGFFVADKQLFYTAMARDAGWGKDVPDMLRNEDWNYAVFTLDKKHRPGVNQAECLACHKPLDKVSYTFTLKELAAAK